MKETRIEKRVLLRAPRSRVWLALTDSREFGIWFGMRLDGEFAPGARLRGVIAPTTVDPEVAEMQRPFAGRPVEPLIDQVDPERLFSFRWHPCGVEAGVDCSKEPMTLVTFTLEEKEDGVLLTVTESGFDEIPLARRGRAFEADEGGWSKQMELVAKYLARVR